MIYFKANSFVLESPFIAPYQIIFYWKSLKKSLTSTVEEFSYEVAVDKTCINRLLYSHIFFVKFRLIKST